jgi:hypothetical protein
MRATAREYAKAEAPGFPVPEKTYARVSGGARVPAIAEDAVRGAGVMHAARVERGSGEIPALGSSSGWQAGELSWHSAHAECRLLGSP